MHIHRAFQQNKIKWGFFLGNFTYILCIGQQVRLTYSFREAFKVMFHLDLVDNNVFSMGNCCFGIVEHLKYLSTTTFANDLKSGTTDVCAVLYEYSDIRLDFLRCKKRIFNLN
jgi:hypothetical protein